LGWVGSTVGNIGFVFDFILPAAYTVGACALTSILPSFSLIDRICFEADTKTTPASVQGVGVDFEIDMDSASPERLKRVRNRTERFRCVFGSADGCEVWKNLVSLG
jgi:hypothetical protein